jgi:hypothetical protein
VAAAVALAACAAPADKPTAVQSGTAESSSAAPKTVPVVMTAKTTPFVRAEFGTGGPYSCAKVVITNHTTGNVEVNPFFFELTGTDNEKRKGEVGAAKGEFEDLTLAPGEKASGTVCAEASVPVKQVTFTDGVSEIARAATS